ncbi:MAG TPA: threonine--tRNA ligase [Candidatus Paceibacterota bacterium]
MADQKLSNLRHSLSHLLAAAVKEIYPDAKPTLGPAIENGFYYDFDDLNISDGDLPIIEAKMKEILPSWEKFEGKEITEEEVRNYFKNNPYKLELIDEILSKGEKITLYTSGPPTGGFTDLCRGGHIDNPSKIDPRSFKLSHIAGAYWRGNEKNKMLTRIYGLAFSTKEELKEYLKMQEEAEKRDHRILGKELGLFIFSDLVGPGLPLYTPKGNVLRNEIVNFSRELNNKIGYEEVHTPNINKAELFKISGHYEKYKEDMLEVKTHYSKEEYFLKPMNCPQHTQIYASQTRSYRDLPIRIADFANLYRDERPGELSGLTRLRYFAQDDGHCFCTEEQIEEEFLKILGVVEEALKTYKMQYTIWLSLRDLAKKEKYVGTDEVWEDAEEILRKILKKQKINFIEKEGEAAFYGPKMDIVVKDAIGREWQISTIQLDFNMPERFGLKFADHDGKEKTPIMIHRALVGSPDRFLGILIEHYAGAFPVWLSPIQVKILPIGEAHQKFAQQIFDALKESGIRAELDDSNETLGKKIRNWKIEKIPYAIVIGDKEVESKKIKVESRDKGDLGQVSSEEFTKNLKEEISDKK